MKFILNGYDFSHLVVENDGFTINYRKRTSGGSFESINNKTFDNFVGYKVSLDILIDPMEQEELRNFGRVLLLEKHPILVYDDPILGFDRCIECLLPDFSASQVLELDKKTYWAGIPFSFEER